MLKKIIKNKLDRSKNILIYNDDLFVVEFPKSGITWFTTILANTICLQNQLFLFPTQFNLEQFVGDVHVSKHINHKSYHFPGYRVIKSHSKYNQSYRHVVYLIRHPYSVMKSYFHFVVNNNKFSATFSDFLSSNKYGINAWCNHVDSWLNPVRPLKLHLVRYEDLIDKPFETIENLYSNIGWDVSVTCIQESIKKSSFQSMKKSDELYKENCPFRKYSFVREGKKKAFLNVENKRYIDTHANKIISEYYSENKVSE